LHGGGAEPVLLGKAHIAKAVVPVLEEIDLSTEELEPGTEEEVQPVVEEAVQESAGPAKTGVIMTRGKSSGNCAFIHWWI